MRLALPGALRAFVDEQVAFGGFASAGEYVVALIQREHDRARLRGALLEGASSPIEGVADGTFFDALRRRTRRA
jgi:antitoxin ParD1/3/4